MDEYYIQLVCGYQTAGSERTAMYGIYSSQVNVFTIDVCIVLLPGSCVQS